MFQTKSVTCTLLLAAYLAARISSPAFSQEASNARDCKQIMLEGVALYDKKDFAGAKRKNDEALLRVKDSLDRKERDLFLRCLRNSALIDIRLGDYDSVKKTLAKLESIEEFYSLFIARTSEKIRQDLSSKQQWGLEEVAYSLAKLRYQPHLKDSKICEEFAECQIDHVRSIVDSGKPCDKSELYKKILVWIKEHIGADTRLYAEMLNQVGVCEKTLSEGGPKLEEALSYFEKHLRSANISDEDKRNDELAIAQINANIGKFCLNEKKAKEAETRYRNALNIRQRLVEQGSALQLKAMKGLAQAYSQLGKNAEAESLNEQIIAARQRASETGSRDNLNDLRMAASACLKQAKYSKATSLYEQVLEEAAKRKLPEDMALAAVHREFAEALNATGNFSKAQLESKKCLEIYRRLGKAETVIYANEVLNLARYQSKGGQFDLAEKTTIEAKELFQKVCPMPQSYLIVADTTLAGIYAQQPQKFEMANKVYKNLLTQIDSSKDLIKYKEVVMVHSARLCMALGKYNEAKDKLLTVSADNSNYVLGLLGNVYLELGNYVEAQNCFERARPIIESKLGQSNKTYAENLVYLSRAYMRQGMTGKAEELVNNVLNSLKNADSSADHVKVDALKTLAELEFIKGHDAEAERHLETAIQLTSQNKNDAADLALQSKLEFAILSIKLGKAERGRTLIKECSESITTKYGANSIYLVQLLSRYSNACTRYKQPAEARIALAKLLEIQEKQLKPDSPELVSLRSQLKQIDQSVTGSNTGTTDAKSSTQNVADIKEAPSTLQEKEALARAIKLVDEAKSLLVYQKPGALSPALEALRIIEAAFGANSMQVVDKLFLLNRCYLQEKKYDELIENCKRIVGTLEKKPPSVSHGALIAAAQGSIAHAYNKKNDTENATKSYDIQIETLRKNLPANDSRIGFAIVEALKAVSSKKNNLDKRLPEILEAFSILTAFAGRLAQLDAPSSDASIARDSVNSNWTTYVKTQFSPDGKSVPEGIANARIKTSKALTELAFLAIKGGLTSKAQQMAVLSANSLKSIKFSNISNQILLEKLRVSQTDSFIDSIIVFIHLNDYGTARGLLEAFCETLDSNAPATKARYASCKMHLAELCERCGDYASAEAYGKSAVLLDLSLKNRNLPVQISVLANSGKTEEALKLAELYVQELEKRPMTDAYQAIRRLEALQQVGRLAMACNKIDQAKKACFQQRSISESPLVSKLPIYRSLAQIQIAKLFIHQSEFGEAMKVLPSVVDELEKLQELNHAQIPEYLDALRELTVLNLKQEQNEAASETCKKLAASTELFWNSMLPGMSLPEQLIFIEKHVAPTHNVLINVMQSSPASRADLLPKLIHWKGLAVELIRNQSKLTQKIETANKVAQIRLIDAKLSHARSDLSTKEKSELLADKEEIERAIKFQNSNQDQQVSIFNANAESLDSILFANEAFIDFRKYEPVNKISKSGDARYCAIISRKSFPTELVDIGQAKTVDDSCLKWLGMMSDPFNQSAVDRGTRDAAPSSPISSGIGDKETLSAIASEFDSLLWKNLRPKLASTTKVFISSDGELAKLPWSSLFNSDDASPLTVICDNPTTLFKARKNPIVPQRNKKIVLTGNIRFRDADRLPQTEVEVKSIANLAEKCGIQSTVLTADLASKTKVLPLLSSCSFAHFATHGYFAGVAEENNGTVAYRAVGNRGGGFEQLPGLFSRNPLLISGILFSSTGPEDPGRLSAEELISVDLSNCELLTLSACQTGLGKTLSGQGVIGLRSAANAAGCQSVLMSLWKVDDKATRALMEQFYANLWENPQDKAKALLKAQQTIRKMPEFQHPYYWAAWVLSGSGW